MKTRKQFQDVEVGVCRLVSSEDLFVPEMSLPIEDILRQFSYVDNVRMGDLAAHGYDGANTDEDDFDVQDFDQLDPAERQEVYGRAAAIVDAYQRQMERQKKNPEDNTDKFDVDESVLP